MVNTRRDPNLKYSAVKIIPVINSIIGYCIAIGSLQNAHLPLRKRAMRRWEYYDTTSAVFGTVLTF